MRRRDQKVEEAMCHRSVALLVAAAALAAPTVRAQQALFCQEAGTAKTFVLTVNWRAQDGKEDEVAEILTQIGEASRAEPGTLAFVIHRSPNDPHEFFLYEQYRDQEAYQAHQQTPHFKDLVLARATPMLARRDRVVLDLMPSYAGIWVTR
jgi:quinol monooxygenase YgiN